jgi:hypothetical protein
MQPCNHYITTGHYSAWFRGDVHVAYACPGCGYRATAVSFEEAEGHSRGVNATPALASADAENRARSRLLATIHVMPCPRCGMHPPELLSAIDECIRSNARRAALRSGLRVVALAAFASAAWFVASWLRGTAPWFAALIALPFAAVAVIVFLIAMDMVPTVPPVLMREVPPQLRFES